MGSAGQEQDVAAQDLVAADAVDLLVDTWLDPSLTDREQVRQLVASVPEPQLVPREVGPDVGNVRNDRPDLIEPVTR